MHVTSRRLRARAGSEHGFSLPELLVSMTVFGLLITAFATLTGAMITHSGEITGESVLQTQARSAVDELVADLRQAYTGDTSSQIESFSSTAITFLSPDRATPFHLRRVSYQLTAGKLQRRLQVSTNTALPYTYGAWSAWATRLDSIKNAAVFTGYDANGTATTTASAIRSVVVSVTVATTAARGRQFTYSARATLRGDAIT